MLTSYYISIRLLHVCCVGLSGCLFTVRGALRIGNSELANHAVLRVMSYMIDTTLLIAAVLLMLILHQYPFVNEWLTVKVLLLLLYIILGTMAQRGAKTTLGRLCALVAALSIFTFIIGVAVTHRPTSWFSLNR